MKFCRALQVDQLLSMSSLGADIYVYEVRNWFPCLRIYRLFMFFFPNSRRTLWRQTKSENLRDHLFDTRSLIHSNITEKNTRIKEGFQHFLLKSSSSFDILRFFQNVYTDSSFDLWNQGYVGNDDTNNQRWARWLGKGEIV